MQGFVLQGALVDNGLFFFFAICKGRGEHMRENRALYPFGVFSPSFIGLMLQDQTFPFKRSVFRV